LGSSSCVQKSFFQVAGFFSVGTRRFFRNTTSFLGSEPPAHFVSVSASFPHQFFFSVAHSPLFCARGRFPCRATGFRFLWLRTSTLPSRLTFFLFEGLPPPSGHTLCERFPPGEGHSHVPPTTGSWFFFSGSGFSVLPPFIVRVGGPGPPFVGTFGPPPPVPILFFTFCHQFLGWTPAYCFFDSAPAFFSRGLKFFFIFLSLPLGRWFFLIEPRLLFDSLIRRSSFVSTKFF